MTRGLILALGNDLIGDDGAALVAARELQRHLGSGIDVVETAAGGFGLLDYLEHYTHVLILDTIVSGIRPPGTLFECAAEDLGASSAGSPHTVGLPDAIALAKRLSIPLPAVMTILAVEIDPPTVIGAPLSAVIAEALPAMIDRAESIMRSWTSPTPA